MDGEYIRLLSRRIDPKGLSLGELIRNTVSLQGNVDLIKIQISVKGTPVSPDIESTVKAIEGQLNRFYAELDDRERRYEGGRS